MRDAYAVGRTVLNELDRGRALAIAWQKERGAWARAAVERLAVEDALRFGARGRAARIARKLHGVRSERQVKRILDDLSRVSD